MRLWRVFSIIISLFKLLCFFNLSTYLKGISTWIIANFVADVSSAVLTKIRYNAMNESFIEVADNAG